jgi:hypothetical protein
MPHARTIFATVDTLDPRAVADFFAEDATMAFGNREPLVGQAAIMAGNQAFMATLKGLRHRILNEWNVGADTIAETEVTYTRHDDKEVAIPVVSIWRARDDGLIVDYRIFFDVTPLYAP